MKRTKLSQRQKSLVLLLGVGIGLALVKRMIEIYSGEIWIESQGDGQGFCFTLPIQGGT